MKKHLYTFVNYQQDNLSKILAIVEFVANNNKWASTKLFPFFASKGLYLHMSFDIIDIFDANTWKRIYKQKTLDISGNIESTWEFAQKAKVSG